MQKLRMALTMGFVATIMIVLNQNCSKVGFEEQASSGVVKENTGDVRPLDPFANDLPDRRALAYGAEADDREFLAKKLLGYQAPHISEIFGRWRRFSGNTIYATAADIKPEPAFGFCFTSLDLKTGDWMDGTDPKGNTIKPGSDSQCINSVSFDAASWTYLKEPDRLRCATNAGNYNGFISAIPFERYVNQAVVTSTNVDDDEISLVIATVVKDDVVHTLSVIRSHGGAGSPKGFGLVYRQGSETITKIAELSVGGVNTNRSTVGDGKGWSGRSALLRVERDGDKVRAFTSIWQTDQTKLAIEPTSLLSIDLADPALGLEIFRGPQFYGYSTLSQLGTEFREIKFTTTTDDQFVYDLMKDLVYKQNGDGTYAVVKGKSALTELGYPRKVINTEIQKVYHLNGDRTFDVLKLK